MMHTPATHRIAAPVPTVWPMLADVPSWPTLDPSISDVSTDGPLTSGTRCRWTYGRRQAAARFVLVDPLTRSVWTEHGRLTWTSNWFDLEPHGAETRVSAAVRVDGPAHALPGVMATPRARLDARVAGLRREAEAASCP